MTAQEMLTVAVDRIPVKIALMDNKKLGMIGEWQEIIYGGNYHSAHLPGPRWDLLAEAYGLPTFRATTPRRSTVRSAPRRHTTGRRSSGSRSPRPRTSSR